MGQVVSLFRCMHSQLRGLLGWVIIRLLDFFSLDEFWIEKALQDDSLAETFFYSIKIIFSCSSYTLNVFF